MIKFCYLAYSKCWDECNNDFTTGNCHLPGLEPSTLGGGFRCSTTVLPHLGLYHKTFYGRNLEIFIIS